MGWLTEEDTRAVGPAAAAACDVLRGVAFELNRHLGWTLRVPPQCMCACYDGDGAHYVPVRHGHAPRVLLAARVSQRVEHGRLSSLLVREQRVGCQLTGTAIFSGSGVETAGLHSGHCEWQWLFSRASKVLLREALRGDGPASQRPGGH